MGMIGGFMSYRRLNEDQMLELQPTLERLSALREGQSALLAFESEESCEKARLLLYSWLFFRNEKSLYRIRRASPSELLVSRRAAIRPSSLSVAQPGDKIASFVCDVLLGLDEPDIALAIGKAVFEETLSLEESLEALREWKRITSDGDDNG
jgi:hypothetical protein